MGDSWGWFSLRWIWAWICGGRDRIGVTDFERSALTFTVDNRKIVECTHGCRPYPGGTQLVFKHVFGEERDHHLPQEMAERIAGDWLHRCMRESFLGRVCVAPCYKSVMRCLRQIGILPPVAFAGAPPLYSRIWMYCLGGRGALGFGGLFDFGKRKVTWRLVRDRLLLISRIYKRRLYWGLVATIVFYFLWGCKVLSEEADYMGLPMKSKREWVRVMSHYPRFLVVALVTSVQNFFTVEIQFPLIIISIVSLIVVADMTFSRKL